MQYQSLMATGVERQVIKRSAKFDAEAYFDHRIKNCIETRDCIDLVDEIEQFHRCKRKRVLPKMDYSCVLPKNLRRRVQKIIPYDYYDYDRYVFLDPVSFETPKQDEWDSTDDDEQDGQKKEKPEIDPVDFHESEISDIVQMDDEFNHCVLNVDRSIGIEQKAVVKPKINWMARYICKELKDRVVWNSKLYDLTNFNKSLDQKAEELMDASVESIVEWLKTLGIERKSPLSKEQMKSLFSIEVEMAVAQSIQCDAKHVTAIAQSVAEKWQIPDRSIELRYTTYINKLLNQKPAKRLISAFGSTIPDSEKPWIKPNTLKKFEPAFSEELLSQKKIWRGTTRLRTMSNVITFLKNHPTVKKPQYLKEMGLFTKQGFRMTYNTQPPLYERLKLKY